MPKNTPYDIPLDQVQAIIFDHDGTLVDSEPVHHQKWQATLAAFDIPLTREYYQTELSGKPTITSAQMLVERHNLNIAANDLCEQKLHAVHEHLRHSPFPLMPNTLTLLQWAATQPLSLGVASGASLFEVDNSLKAHNLTSFFASVATRDHVINNKPAPDVYLHAAETLGVNPQYCLAIEDSDSGQLSAINANMMCLRLDTYSALEPHAKCLKINDLMEIKHLFEKL